MPNVLSPRDRVFRPDNMDETVLSSLQIKGQITLFASNKIVYMHIEPNKICYHLFLIWNTAMIICGMQDTMISMVKFRISQFFLLKM